MAASGRKPAVVLLSLFVTLSEETRALEDAVEALIEDHGYVRPAPPRVVLPAPRQYNPQQEAMRFLLTSRQLARTNLRNTVPKQVRMADAAAQI